MKEKNCFTCAYFRQRPYSTGEGGDPYWCAANGEDVGNVITSTSGGCEVYIMKHDDSIARRIGGRRYDRSTSW